jgi:[ribosomal protein S5]-alanine N-acetyltransferase
MENKSPQEKCAFLTSRLYVESWRKSPQELKFQDDLLNSVIETLSPTVTRFLPKSWQNINTLSAARNWIEARDQEACFLTIYSNDDNTIIGFISLYEDVNWSDQSLILLRFGYLISEANWNQGLGTEVLQGLLTWCQSQKNILRISGGVRIENISSTKVMKKVGFHQSTDTLKSDPVVFYEYEFKPS